MLGERRASIAPSHTASEHKQPSEHRTDDNNDTGSESNLLKVVEQPARVPMLEGVTTIGSISAKCPRISALGSLRAVGSGQSIQIVETKGANNDSEVAAASRDPFTGTGHNKFILSVAFSPDGSLIASGSGDQLVILWDTKTCARRSALIGHNSGVRCVEFSHDGMFLASASSDHNCILWDCLRGNQRAQLKGHTMEVNTVAFAPDSSFLYSGGVDKTIFVWDLRAPVVQLLTKISGHTGHIHSIATSPDGNYMLSAGADKQIIVWDTSNAGSNPAAAGGGGDSIKQIESLTRHTRDIHCVAFSVDGSQFATGGADSLIVVWNGSTFSEHLTLKGHTNRVMSLAFSPSGNLLVSASMDKTIGIWDPVKGGLMRGQLKEHGHQVYSVAFPRQQLAGNSSNCFASGSFSSNFIFWEMTRGRINATLEGAHTKANISFVEWVQLPEASHRLLVKSTDAAGEEYLWDAESGRTTQLERVIEQESKLREMDDMRIHQEKMQKLGKQRQENERKAELVKKGLLVQNEDGDFVTPEGMDAMNLSSTDVAFGEMHHTEASGMYGGDGSSLHHLSPARLESLIAQLPDKIAHAVASSPDSAVRRKLLGPLANQSKSQADVASRDSHSQAHLGDDQQSVLLGGGHHAGNTSFNFGNNKGGASRRGSMYQAGGGGANHSRGISGGVGGSNNSDQGGNDGHHHHHAVDTTAIQQSIQEVKDQQKTMQKEMGELHKDVNSLRSEMKNMTQMMGEMMKLMKKK